MTKTHPNPDPEARDEIILEVRRAKVELARRYGCDAYRIAAAAHAADEAEDIETRAKRGDMKTLERVLARVPDVPPAPGDEL